MKILVLGSLNIDRVYRVHNFVRPKETIHAESFSCTCGGKGFNQTIALARAGSDVSFAGVVGADGVNLSDTLVREGIDTTFLKHSANANGHTIIQVNDLGENCIIVVPGANAETSCEYISSVISHFSAGDWIVLQNEIENVDYAIDFAGKQGLHVALNPSPFDERIPKYNLNAIDLLMINEVEGEALTGVNEPEKMLQILRERYKRMAVLLTLGEKGALFFDPFGKMYFEPSVPCIVKDTTAAGDTFTGYFLTEYIKSGDAVAALSIASLASSITVSREGAADSIPYKEEVIRRRT